MKHLLTISALLALGLVACGDDASSPRDAGTPKADARPPLPSRYSREKLMDPKTCASCHPRHYDEWSGSMHAYASIDPVFLAMNKRGQRETEGKLGNFCVNCHAPMAVREGLISEGGLDLEQAPKWAQGVTCYFCHNAVGLENPDQHFNGNIKLANDQTMRGSFEGIDPGVHGVERSSFHSKNSRNSSVLCGTCHDVVNDKGVHIERTFAEYKDSIFSFENPTVGGKDTCQGCHMPVTGEMALIATNPDLNTKLETIPRDHHEHRWPGVDIALTDDFPQQEQQRFATECEIHRSANVQSIDVSELGEFTIRLETQAGHAQPSGTAQDRRMWLEFIAYDEAGKVLYETGTIGDREVEQMLNDKRPNRPLRVFRDHMKDADGNDVHMFWEAAAKSESDLLMPAKKIGDFEHYEDVRITMPNFQKPARAVMRLRLRPMGMDVLQSLVDSGDLDPKFLDRVPTFTINNTYVEWRAEDGSYTPSNKLRFVEELPEECDPLLR